MQRPKSVRSKPLLIGENVPASVRTSQLSNEEKMGKQSKNMDGAAPPRKVRKTTRSTPMRQRGVSDSSARSRLQADSDLRSTSRALTVFSRSSFSRSSQLKTAFKISVPSVRSSALPHNCTRSRVPVSPPLPPERLKLLARASPPLQVSVCRGRSSHAVFHGPVPQTKHAGCTRPPTTQHRPGDSSEAQGGSGACPTSTLAPGTRGPRCGSSMITCHVFTMPGNFRNGSSQSPATPSLARKR